MTDPTTQDCPATATLTCIEPAGHLTDLHHSADDYWWEASDTPAPATALTDDQINFNLETLRMMIAAPPVGLGGLWDRTLAAIVARAKRKERERIGDELAAWLDAENAPPIWHEAVDIADPTWCDRHPEEADHA